MRRLIIIASLCVISAGCEAPSPKDEAAVYEAVLHREVGEQAGVANVFLFVDGKDPTPEMLDQFVKKFPAPKAGSKVPAQGMATRVSLDGLEWINANTAEVSGGFSNGMDGRHSLYRVVRKQGEWVVEKAEVKAIS